MLQEEINELKEWLIEQDYWQGVKLYDLHGGSEFLKELFRANQDELNHQYLESEIEKLITDSEIALQETLEQYPKKLQDQVDIAKRLMDERSSLKTMLRVLYLEKAPEDLLKKACFKILDLNDELNDIYDNERFFKKMGYLPDSTDFAIENGEYLLKRLYNLRTYVSRYKNKPDKLQQYSNELFEVEKKLDQLGLIRIENEQKTN